MNDINDRQNRPSEKAERGRGGHTAYIVSLLLLAAPFSVGIWTYFLLSSLSGWAALFWLWFTVCAFPVFILCALPICIRRPAFGWGGVAASTATCAAAMAGLVILMFFGGSASGDVVRGISYAILSGGFVGLFLSLWLPGKHRPSETAETPDPPDDNRPGSGSENKNG